MIHPILLCGGSGTRLWPLSRKSYPKQFAKLMGEESLFQASARRLSGAGFAAPMILTGDPFRFIVTEQLAAIEQAPQAILIEPEGRNTAPALLAAALAPEDPEANVELGRQAWAVVGSVCVGQAGCRCGARISRAPAWAGSARVPGGSQT